MAIFNSCVKLPEGSLGTDSCAMTLLNRCWTRLRWERTQVVDDLPADMSSFQAAVASDHRKIRKLPWSLVDVHGFSRFFPATSGMMPPWTCPFSLSPHLTWSAVGSLLLSPSKTTPGGKSSL